MLKFAEFLNESSLSRVWRAYKNHESVTISAFRSAHDCNEGSPISKSENLDRSSKLKQLLIGNGYSVTKIAGTYIEDYGSSKEKPVKEEAFLVVNHKNSSGFLRNCMILASKFEQDSITYSEPDGSYFLISTNTCRNSYPGNGKIGVRVKLGKPMFSKTGQFHSKINGRPFVFEEVLGPRINIELRDLDIGSIRSASMAILSENMNYLVPAYWIDPEGIVIAVKNRHIGIILEKPGMFGETKKTIEDIYKKHEEPISPTVEGKAREEIMERVLKRGFIRIRETRNKWTVQVWKRNQKSDNAIWWWAKNIAQDPRHKFDDVIVHELMGSKMDRSTIKKIMTSESVVDFDSLNQCMFISEQEYLQEYFQDCD